MALTKDVNSYATVAEADVYFGDRFDSESWAAASPETKAKALISATSRLDEMPWVGTAIFVEQDLAFPRVGSYFDPRLGSTVYIDSTETPRRVFNACMELALHYLNNPGILVESGSVKSIGVGSVNLTSVRGVEQIPSVVTSLIKPLLINLGASSWWRAN